MVRAEQRSSPLVSPLGGTNRCVSRPCRWCVRAWRHARLDLDLQQAGTSSCSKEISCLSAKRLLLRLQTECLFGCESHSKRTRWSMVPLCQVLGGRAGCRVSQHAWGLGSVAHQASLGDGGGPSRWAMTGRGVRASCLGPCARVTR